MHRKLRCEYIPVGEVWDAASRPGSSKHGDIILAPVASIQAREPYYSEAQASPSGLVYPQSDFDPNNYFAGGDQGATLLSNDYYGSSTMYTAFYGPQVRRTPAQE